MAQARPARCVHRHPQSGQAQGNARAAGALRHRSAIGRRARPRRAGGNRQDLRRRMRASRRWPRPRRPAAPAFADDSGLVVDALDGEPGIHSARWAGPDKDFRAAMNRIQTLLIERGAKTPEQRRAHFVAALCLAWPDGHVGGIRGPRRWRRRLAAARRQRLRLRSAVPARRLRPHLRRDERARKSTGCRRKAKGLSHRARAFVKLAAGLPAPRLDERATCTCARNRYNFKYLSAAKSHPRWQPSPTRPMMVNMTSTDAPFGVYVHWPFCLSKCPYCDFNSHVRHGGIDEARFVRAFEARDRGDRRAHAAAAPCRASSSAAARRR